MLSSCNKHGARSSTNLKGSGDNGEWRDKRSDRDAERCKRSCHQKLTASKKLALSAYRPPGASNGTSVPGGQSLPAGQTSVGVTVPGKQ